MAHRDGSTAVQAVKFRFILAFIFILLGVPLFGDESRPKIGLALSGGGAKGYAHIGVLKVLEEMHVPIASIAGTSMGAVIGALYASGMSPEEIERVVAASDWNQAIEDSTSYAELSYRRKLDVRRYPSTTEFGVKNRSLKGSTGIKTGQKFNFLLSRYLLPVLDETDFSKFPIPFVAVATDLETGEPVVLDRGDIAEAVSASMSIPAVFTPLEIDGRILVDGGAAMNAPVDAVRAMGADVVIAVDIGAPLATREKLQSTIAIVDQMSTMLTRANMERQLAKADLVLTPDIKGISIFDFSGSREIVPRGVAAAEEKREQLSAYAIDPDEYARKIGQHRVPRERKIVIDQIRLDGIRFVDERFILERLYTKIGQPLDLDVLERDIAWLYGSADFVGLRFGLVDSSGNKVLVIRVTEKPWGPNYIRAGLSLETDPGSGVDLNLLLSYNRRWINSLGAEWRTDLSIGRELDFSTEFYQPLDFDRPGFVRAGSGYREDQIDLYSGEDNVSEYEASQLRIYSDAGFLMSSFGEASLGFLYRWTSSRVTIGLPNLPPVDEDEGAMTAGLEIDTRDDPFMPLRGFSSSLQVIAPLESLGADHDYARVSLDTAGFATAGRHTFTCGVRLHDSFGGEPAVYDYAILGGFGNLGGFAPGQLFDKAASLARLGYYFQAKELTSILGRAIYLGGLVEAGNVGRDIEETLDDPRISVTGFLGLNTTIGPAFLSLAKAEGAGVKFYLTIGQTF